MLTLSYCFIFISIVCISGTANERGEALVLLPQSGLPQSSDSKLSLQFRTKQDNGMLMHLAAKDSYSTITLNRGRLNIRFKAEQADELSFWTSPKANLTVDDDQWHKVEFSRQNNTFWLKFDSIQYTFIDSHNIAQDKKLGHIQGLFLGGCGNSNGSQIQCFHGCITNVSVNGVLIEDNYVLPDALKCYDVAVTERPQLDSFPLPNDPDIPVSNDYAAAVDHVIQPVYVDHPLVVGEGNSTILESRHLYVYQQHMRYVHQYSNIVFRLLGKPRHGKLTMGRHAVGNSFTYEDLLRRIVNYTHDGSETREDSLELEVVFQNLSRHAPDALRRRYTYSLGIRIASVNDPPQLLFPNGNVIRLAQNSRLLITQEHLLIADPDHSPQNVIIKIMNSTNGGAIFEHIDRPAIPLKQFSQEELIGGRIRLMHFGPSKSSINIAAYDSDNGHSRTKELKIVAIPVQIYSVRNTGVHVLQRSSELITNYNLSFSTNIESERKKLDIRYKIVKIPQSGFVEIEDDAGRWWIASEFNQSDINEARVRYRHAKQEKPTSDVLRFQVSCLNTTSQIVYDLKITFVPVNIKVFNPSPFMLNATQQGFLSRKNLFAWTFPRSSPSELLIYHVTGPPKYGFLYRVVDSDSGRNRRLGLYSNFSQADIDNEKIFYRLHFVHYSILTDQFRFKVVAPFVSSEQLQFDISFLPGEEGIRLINRTVIVGEGRLQKIRNTSLYLETPDDKDFIFTIAVAPSHGEFHRLIPGGIGTSQLGAKDNFTTQDLINDRLLYRHDDSETSEDKSYLVARPLHRVNEDARIPFWLHIRVILENDHEPERLTNEPFHVVVRGERTLTTRDLKFIDQDTDFDSKNLRYFFGQEYSSGGFYMMRSPDVPVYNFSQDDINQGRLLFRHLGKKKLFSLPFSISDGQKKVQSHFFVNASGPFLREKVNTGLMLEPNGMVVIGSNNLTLDTNLNTGSSSIIFEVTDTLEQGQLMVMQTGSEEGKPRKLFTQNDIDNKRVLYSDKGGVDREDRVINMRVQAASLELWIELKVSIRSNQPKQLLELKIGKDLVVSEGGVAEIGSDVLLASHPNYMTGSIKYTVVEPPREGTLILDSLSMLPTSNAYSKQLITHNNFYVHEFSQFDINNGKLQYLHNGSKKKHDAIVFNVTAGNEKPFGPNKLTVNVVKSKIFLQVSNVTVPVGGKVRLSRLIIRAKSAYHDFAQFLFQLSTSPSHGFLQNVNGTVISSFTSQELSQGIISYGHDDGSSWKDQFSLKALLQDNGKVESEPRTIYVTVVHRNLKAPELVRNSPLQMWSNRVAPIASDLLYFDDSDTPAERIRFLVTSPNNGYLAFMSAPSRPIFNFSQADVTAKRVAFVRFPNGTSGGFSFLVTDGVHQVGPIWFSVEAAEVSVALEANARLIVAPETQAVLGMDLLRANIAGTQAWQIFYTINRQPRHGQLMVGDERSNVFTQLEINQRLVTYSQDTSRPKSWVIKDGFHFTVSLNGTGSFLPELEEDGRFRILISYAVLPPDKINKYIVLSTVLVPEGGSVAINSSHLNSTKLAVVCNEQLVMRIVKMPKFAWLQFGTKNVSELKMLRFTQKDINDHILVYHQTPSENKDSNEDVIGFEIFPSSESHGKRRQLRLKFQLHIQIIPVSNKQFTTRNFANSLRLVRATSIIVSSDQFLVENPGTTPSNIKYDVFQGPSAGYFTLNDEKTKSFTQADINKAKVRFVQIGSIKEGAYSVRVSAENVHPISRVVQIQINRLTLTLVNSTTIKYRQGTNYIVLTKQHLGADSNGPREQITYNISRLPENGTFLWVAGEAKATVFTQSDIDGQRVLYAQVNLEAWKDSFAFKVSNSQNYIGPKELNINVEPAVTQRPLRITPGQTLTLTTEYLDASEIEDKEPRFLIIDPPVFGKLIKKARIERRSVEINETDQVTFFTYFDLKQNTIHYASSLDSAIQETEDSFTYEVQATGMQPARAIFRIHIRPTSTTDGGRSGPILPITPSTDEHKNYWPAKMTQSYMLVIYMLGGVVLLAVLFIVIRKVRISRRRERKYMKEKHQALLQIAPHSNMPSPQPDLLGTTVYASVGARTARNGSPNGHRMAHSLTREPGERITSKGTKMSPPPIMNMSLRPNSADGSTNRLITFDPGRTELISSVPMCKVTPLTPRGATSGISSSGNSSADEYKYAYQYSSSASDTDLKCERLSLDRATGQRSRKSRNHPPSTNATKMATKLKDNQYWV